ncbi:hypothetical protein COU61_03995 [Candidatus Pacearchaeota archaeon CG10_big_fil_rev_8_21_14_0_10_35_13]|nr:MAG: hypothetical protein COU61_03995 [Candidatus Pacearchaeota archaeon CG10_big_fil_rev_8_21_14_0_10_35_13]
MDPSKAPGTDPQEIINTRKRMNELIEGGMSPADALEKFREEKKVSDEKVNGSVQTLIDEARRLANDFVNDKTTISEVLTKVDEAEKRATAQGITTGNLMNEIKLILATKY